MSGDSRSKTGDSRRNRPVFSLKSRFSVYGRLMRLEKPIGTWLLLLPCWWGVALASPAMPDIVWMLLFAAGAVVMRGAGCVVNDIYDRKLDRQVERTRGRPLASGEASVAEAVALVGVLLAVGFGVLLLFKRATLWIGVLALPLVFTYPLMKRVTWWPQLFLGFTFNWGVLMGVAAVSGAISAAAVFAYIAGVFWTLGYDTIYAHQDKKDDVAAGIKSTALLLGDKSPQWVSLFYALALVFLGLAGRLSHLGWGFEAGLLAAACFAFVQLSAWKPNDAADCLRRFKANRDFGLIVLAAIVLGKIS